MTPAVTPAPRLAFVIQQVGHPFTSSAPFTPVTLDLAPHAAAAASWKVVVPPSLWIAGLVGLLIFWLLRWWRIRSVIRDARWPEDGREWEALQRLRKAAG